MQSANDNVAQTPLEIMAGRIVDNPCQMFGIRPELMDYFMHIGSVSPRGRCTWGEVADAIEAYRASGRDKTPLWRLYAEHNGEVIWLAAQRCESHKKWSWVYFIDGYDAVKIGTSVCPTDRVREMQTGNWRKLELLGVMRGGPTTEAALHELFSDLHIRGEWFRREASILDFIAERCGAYGEMAA